MTGNRDSTRFYSSRQEKKVAKAMSGKVQSNSGATPFFKGDVVTAKFLLECKTTMKDVSSYSIQKVILEKVEEEKFQMNKELSALVFNFGPNTDNYYILTEKGIKALLSEVENLKEEVSGLRDDQAGIDL